MKFSKVCSIKGLIAKHTIYAEVLARLKSLKNTNNQPMAQNSRPIINVIKSDKV
jgi:hypothetical protein